MITHPSRHRARERAAVAAARHGIPDGGREVDRCPAARTRRARHVRLLPLPPHALVEFAVREGVPAEPAPRQDLHRREVLRQASSCGCCPSSSRSIRSAVQLRHVADLAHARDHRSRTEALHRKTAVRVRAQFARLARHHHARALERRAALVEHGAGIAQTVRLSRTRGSSRARAGSPRVRSTGDAVAPARRRPSRVCGW